MTNTIRLAILAAIFLAGAAFGWGINGWRLGRDLEACEHKFVEAQAQGEAYAETARLAAQHKITKIEKVYIERKREQTVTNKQIEETSNALPNAPLLPYPYRVLHDYAATGAAQEVDDPSGIVGEPVAPRTFAKHVAGNYAIARDNARRLEALQEVVRASGCFELAED